MSASGTKLASSVSGAYNSTGKVSSLNKRKRDKAQMKLRDRMRQKFQGSTLTQNRLRSSLTNPSGMAMSGGMQAYGNTNQPTNTLHNLYGDGYWRTQQDRYDSIIHSGPPPHINQRKDIPLQELVDRIHRRGQNSGRKTRNSLLTIKSYKPPVAPYAIQQQPLIRKMVRVAPIKRHKSKAYRTEDQNFDDDDDDNIPPPANSPLHDGDKWKPDVIHIPHSRPNDRDNMNYNLQLQQASLLAEARRDYTQNEPLNQSLNKYTALPNISLSHLQESHNLTQNSNEDVFENEEECDFNNESTDEVENQESVKPGPKIIKKQDLRKIRSRSSSEILSLMKAKKQYKSQKRSEDDFKTLLRTRSRFTSDTKMFKEDLINVRKLSIISEANSAASDGQNRPRSSSSRASSRASVHSLKSVPSLEKIEESNLVKETPVDHAVGTPRIPSACQSRDDQRGMTLIKEEGEGSDLEERYEDYVMDELSDLESSSEDSSDDTGKMEDSGITWIKGDIRYPETPSPTKR